MRKVKVIRIPNWRQNLNNAGVDTINILFELFGHKKNLTIALFTIYSLCFFIIGFLLAVMDHKLL